MEQKEPNMQKYWSILLHSHIGFNPGSFQGSKSLGVPPLDPWPYTKLEYSQKHKPVALYAVASDSETTGLRNSTIHSVWTDWEKMEIQMSSPRIKIKGNYLINGTLIFFPLSGQGEYSVVFEGFKAEIKMLFEKYRKSGHEYIRVKRAMFHPDAENVSVHMTGLFNGNKVLSERTIALINKNWKFILVTVAPLVSETSAIPIVDVCNSIFSRVPVREFIPEKKLY
ncbi:protein takeout-like isoform X2 [Cimex lectularius]|uniref:Uncharacterized protein n=1 Tax=Cimex lectularius TaxID=79782 RepID=A0A8I6SVP6_CIMLE|nr:protein takeout-like isoform X2 [Cimex lectularius]